MPKCYGAHGHQQQAVSVMQRDRCFRWPVASAAVLLVLAGCGSMSKNECLTVDWRTVGYEDGVAGYSGDRIGQHRKACAKYGVSTDLELYQQGRERGLREFCTPVNGYRIGSQGGGYAGVCPENLEPAFLTAFNSGHQLYSLQARVDNTVNRINYKRQELNRAEHGIVSSAVAAVSSESNAQGRADAVVDTAQLAERAGRLQEEIRQLEEERVRYEHDLEAYRSTQPPIT
jgi:hypothetical protein